MFRNQIFTVLKRICDHNPIFHMNPKIATFFPSHSNPRFAISVLYNLSNLQFHPIYYLFSTIKSFSSLSPSIPSSDDLLTVDEPTSCSSSLSISGSSSDRLRSPSDEVYEAIVSSSGVGRGLEAALDALEIELSTELVDYVLGKLRYEEKLALRFFVWVSHQTGYVHQAHTYTFLIDVLSSTGYKSRQFGVVCDVLDYMKRSSGRSIPVVALVEILRKYTEKHLKHLRKFAKKKRAKMKTPPETDAFNLFLDAFCKCSLVEEAEVMFHRVKNKVAPNAESYNILFFGWCRVRDPKKAMKVLEEMIERELPPENFTYNAAIESFCSAGMISEARELFEFMRTKGSTMSSPVAKTYAIMIVELAKHDQMDECFKLIADMRSSGCLPDVSTYKEMVEGMCLAEKVDAAYKVLDEMSHTGFRPDILTYNCFLKVLCNLHKAEEALELCDKMIVAGCEPSVHTYNMVITMFLEMKEPERAIGVWREMDNRGCKQIVDTYGIMIDGLFNCDRAEDAYFLLEETIDRGMKLPYQKFDAILMRLSMMGNLNAIHRLSEHMRKFYNVAMARRFAISQKKKSIGLRRQ